MQDLGILALVNDWRLKYLLGVFSIVYKPLSTSSPSHFHSHQDPPSTWPQSFFCRPAEQVAPELNGCLLVKRQADGELLWGVMYC